MLLPVSAVLLLLCPTKHPYNFVNRTHQQCLLYSLSLEIVLNKNFSELFHLFSVITHYVLLLTVLIVFLNQFLKDLPSRRAVICTCGLKIRR